jgi:ABC-type antimicrobial peptide transport system permease subunit
VNVATVDQVVDATIAGRRFYSVATGAFAVVALTLTTVGLALVVARAVAERRRELAIRSALGATLIRLARAAVGDALVAIAGGVFAGLLLASVGSVLIAQFLFQVAARSPNTYAGAALVVIGVAGVAAWLPMRRFARAPLTQMLRQD